MTYLVLNSLTKRYGAAAVVDGLSLSIAQGEFVSLLGPSGCGKTTTLQMIAGFVEPTAGSIVLNGKDLHHTPANQRGLGLVFQNYALFPHMTAAQNVAFGLEMQGVAKAECASRVAEMLKLVDLAHLADRYPARMSGGQQQRVALARALVIKPKVLLLDEPLSNLDAKLREEARAFLKELIERENLAALMVTHDQSEALAIANRILLLNGGVVEQAGTPQDMYNAPETLFVAEFMGSNNHIEGKIMGMSDGRASIRIGDFLLDGQARCAPEKVGQAGSAVIRLEGVHVADGSNGGQNHVKLDLVTSMFLGHTWEHLFRGRGMTIRTHHDGPLSSGAHWLHLPADRVWIF